MEIGVASIPELSPHVENIGILRMIKIIVRSLFYSLLFAGGLLSAAPIVVTPGSSAGYLYVPAVGGPNVSGAGGDSVGGISLQKNGTTEYTVNIGNKGLCGLDCSHNDFNTGAGFITLTSTVPVIWSNYEVDSIYPQCNGTFTCNIWVNTDTREPVRTTAYTITIVKDPTTSGDTAYSVSALQSQLCGNNVTPCTFYGAGNMVFTSSRALHLTQDASAVPKVVNAVSSSHSVIVTANKTLKFSHPDKGCGQANPNACSYDGERYVLNNGSIARWLTDGKFAVDTSSQPSIYGCFNQQPQAASSSGKVNTQAIIDGVANGTCTYSGGHTAAGLCVAKGPGWFLPSYSEINKITNYNKDLYNMTGNRYWSSFGWSIGNNWFWNDGTMSHTSRANTNDVLCFFSP